MPAVCIILDQNDVLATLLGVRVVGAVSQPSSRSALIGAFVYINQHVCGTLWQSTSTRLHGSGQRLGKTDGARQTSTSLVKVRMKSVGDVQLERSRGVSGTVLRDIAGR
jgi:hypothetical protein